MEKRDLQLIEKYSAVDEELRMYVEEHKKFEDSLEKYNQKPHLSLEEEIEVKRIKKLKLKGRDEIERILSKYRKENADSGDE